MFAVGLFAILMMMTTATPRQPLTAAFLIIGDEILSGRTQEANLAFLAKNLSQKGIPICEARVVPDEAYEIAEAVNALRIKHDVVFTSGGIGPTHDDITTDSIALALGVRVRESHEALTILQNLYRSRGQELTPVRRRMARIPDGAALLGGEGIAPGYRIANLYVCAGVPEIFRLMVTAAMEDFRDQDAIVSVTLRAYIGESSIAEGVGGVQARFPHVKLGSYPKMRDGKFCCDLALTTTDTDALAAARDALAAHFEERGVDYEILQK